MTKTEKKQDTGQATLETKDQEMAGTLPTVQTVGTQPSMVADTTFLHVTGEIRGNIKQELDCFDTPSMQKARALLHKYKGRNKPEEPGLMWKECEDENGTIDFEKLRALLTRQKIKLAPEFSLALSDNPLQDGPFGLSIFVPVDSQSGNESSNMRKNLGWIFNIMLEECGCPEDLRESMKQKLTDKYHQNLAILRQKHPEIRFNGKEITMASIKRAYLKVKSKKSKIHGITREKCERIIQKRSHTSISEPYFGEKHVDATINMLVLLHHIGMINITDLTEQDILRLLDELGKTSGDTIAFLHEGENHFSKMQRSLLRSSVNTEDGQTEIPLDKLDILEQLKNYNLYELLEYTFDEKKRMEWRAQAASIAFVRFKLLNITRNAQYSHAYEVAHHLRDVLTDTGTEEPTEQLWQYDSAGQLQMKERTLYSNDTHDYSTEKRSADGFNYPEIFNFRRWISPISSRVYEIRLVDGLQKNKFAILLKILLKNSEGEPSALYDLVRQTVVFANADLNDPGARKDVYYFLFNIGKRYGLVPAVEDIDWTNDDIETIRHKCLKRRTMEILIKEDSRVNHDTEKKGYFTIEDKADSNINGLSRVNDIKLVGRDPRHSTGMEVQALTIEQYTTGMSLSAPGGHINYEYRKILDVMEIIYPPHAFPETWLIIRLVRSMMKKREIQYEKNNISLIFSKLAQSLREHVLSCAQHEEFKSNVITPLRDIRKELDATIQDIEETIAKDKSLLLERISCTKNNGWRGK